MRRAAKALLQRWSWLLAIMFLTGGCHLGNAPREIRPPYTSFRSPNLLAHPPRRVLVMPVITTVFDGGYAQRWHRLFTSELRAIRRFEVISADPHVPCVQQCQTQATQGLYSEPALLQVKDYYRVDGILFVRMDEFDPYYPPRIALNVNLVDTFSGEAIASIDGSWDTRDEQIQTLIHHYAQHVTTSNELSNADLFLQSPEYFGKYVAHDVAMALCNLFRDERAAIAPSLAPTPTPIGAMTTPCQQPIAAMGANVEATSYSELPHSTSADLPPGSVLLDRVPVRATPEPSAAGGHLGFPTPAPPLSAPGGQSLPRQSAPLPNVPLHGEPSMEELPLPAPVINVPGP